MTLTENATRVYLGTDMGDMARKMEFDRFHSAWCAKIMMLSISKKEEDKKTYEAMKAINSSEFYYDANRDFEWVCNECNSPNLTSSVSEDEIEQELHACINCGCFEMHKRYFR